MKGWRVNALIAGCLLVFFFLQYRLWFETGGVKDMMLLKKILSAQQTENDNLKKRNEMLLFQIQRLQNSKDAAEARARNELGMIKKDEVFYQIVK